MDGLDNPNKHVGEMLLNRVTHSPDGFQVVLPETSYPKFGSARLRGAFWAAGLDDLDAPGIDWTRSWWSEVVASDRGMAILTLHIRTNKRGSRTEVSRLVGRARQRGANV